MFRNFHPWLTKLPPLAQKTSIVVMYILGVVWHLIRKATAKKHRAPSHNGKPPPLVSVLPRPTPQFLHLRTLRCVHRGHLSRKPRVRGSMCRAVHDLSSGWRGTCRWCQGLVCRFGRGRRCWGCRWWRGRLWWRRRCVRGWWIRSCRSRAWCRLGFLWGKWQGFCRGRSGSCRFSTCSSCILRTWWGQVWNQLLGPRLGHHGLEQAQCFHNISKLFLIGSCRWHLGGWRTHPGMFSLL